jgi:hypothetical protein
MFPYIKIISMLSIIFTLSFSNLLNAAEENKVDKDSKLAFMVAKSVRECQCQKAEEIISGIDRRWINNDMNKAGFDV